MMSRWSVVSSLCVNAGFKRELVAEAYGGSGQRAVNGRDPPGLSRCEGGRGCRGGGGEAPL